MDSVIEIWKEENDIALKEKLKERYIKNQLAMEARRKATELKKQKTLQRMIDLRSHQNNSFSKKKAMVKLFKKFEIEEYEYRKAT